MNKNLLKILALLTAIGAISINALAVILPFNNRSTADISNSFNAALVPANYVFSIWGLIYLGLIAFPVYQFIKKEEDFEKVNSLFILSNIANATWIYLWHYGHYKLCLVVMLILLACLIGIYSTLEIGIKKVKKLREIMVNAVFSLYLGWITVATVANAEDTLISSGFEGFGVQPRIWAVLLIIIITVITCSFIYYRKDAVYVGVIIWALFGVFIKSFNEKLIAYSALIACLILLGYIIDVKVLSTEKFLKKK